MLWTDIRIQAGEPVFAFVKAWNRLVDEKEVYLQELEQIAKGEDLLKAYRARELTRLVEQVGHIDVLPYDLMLKTLDHILIGIDAKPEVTLAGTRLE